MVQTSFHVVRAEHLQRARGTSSACVRAEHLRIFRAHFYLLKPRVARKRYYSNYFQCDILPRFLARTFLTRFNLPRALDKQ